MSNALTEIWNLPRSQAGKRLMEVFKVDVTKPKSERKFIYTVRVRFESEEDYVVEADSREEAIKLAQEEIFSGNKVLETTIVRC